MPVAPVAVPTPQTSYAPLSLPATLRGSAKYAVVLRSEDGQAFCLGFKHIYDSAGAQLLLKRIVDKRAGHYRGPVQGLLCDSALRGVMCPNGSGCGNIHCTPAGLTAMRPWSTTRPTKAPRTPPESEVGSRVDFTDEAGALSSEDASDTASDRTTRSAGAPAVASPPYGPAPIPPPPLSYSATLQLSSFRLRQRMQQLHSPLPVVPQPQPLPRMVHEPYAYRLL